jgi:hypothetical protein
MDLGGAFRTWILKMAASIGKHWTASLEATGSNPDHNHRLERVGSIGRESVHHEA